MNEVGWRRNFVLNAIVNLVFLALSREIIVATIPNDDAPSAPTVLAQLSLQLVETAKGCSMFLKGPSTFMTISPYPAVQPETFEINLTNALFENRLPKQNRIKD